MATTSSLQKYPDYYNSLEECNIFCKNYNKIQSNYRYKNFTQINFTAGDEEQFQKYRYDKNNKDEINNINISNNLFYNSKLYVEWEKNKNLNALCVINTFKYIFEKFKKGIFIKIVNNELKVFLPFSNVNFVNEWSSKIKIDPKYCDIYKFFSKISNLDGYTFNKNNVNNFINTWYSNNSLIRYEYPINEGDTNVSCIKNMLEELCKNRSIPDIELFINRRDFPLITRNSYEPYYNIWDSKEKPLISHNYDKYIPILSMSNSESFADILIPSYDDWIRVQNKNNIWFSRASQDYKYIFNTKWEHKFETAVFRGSSTGSGVTIETNQRLKVSYLSYITEKDENDIYYLDAGITKWNVRPKKIFKHDYLEFLDPTTLPFKLVNKLSPLEQSKYKYIIHIDGHVSAYRLSYELSMNSVILIVKSEWKLWYSDLLKPYIHYIPIKEDLSDLIDIIKWCRKNDEKCKEIANNALKFYEKYLKKDGIFDYLQKLFIDVKKNMGKYYYNDIKPINIQLINEYKNIFPNEKSESINFLLENNINEDDIKKLFFDIDVDDINFYPKINKSIKDISLLPYKNRSYGFLRGINFILNMIREKIDIEEYCKYEKDIFKNKLGIVKKFSFKNFELAIKSSSNIDKIKEHIHETFISVNCINKLLKDIPNFVYIFGIYKKNDSYNVITEFIEGKTFQEYIKSDEFNFKEYLMILSQLSLALQYAQEKIGFVHYDLTVWNIIIKRLEKPIEIVYSVNNKIIKIKTKIIPIIIDYGKSHIFYKNIHFGYVNMYNFNTCIDFISVFITSIYQIIIDKNLNKYDFNNLLRLTNFISNTKYCKKTFYNSKDVKTFFYNAKKYSNLVFSNKFELENYLPYDFFEFIIKKFKCYNLDIENIIHCKYTIEKGNEYQVYDFILSKNIDERIQSYLNVINKIKNINFKNDLDNIFLLYFIKNIKDDFYFIKKQLINFLINEKINTKDYQYMFLEIDKKIELDNNMFLNIYKPDDVDYLNINYNDNIFLIKNELEKTLEKINIKNISYNKININIYASIIIQQILTDVDIQTFLKNNNLIINNSNIKNMKLYNTITNINTLKIISKMIYR